MVDVFIVIYCVCCVTIMAMCATSVVYMIHDMLADRYTGEPDSASDADEDVSDDG